MLALFSWTVAVGLDFIEGLEEGHPWDLYTLIAEHYKLDLVIADRYETAFETVRHFSKTIEESIEMFAMTLFWFVFLRYLDSATDEIRVRLAD